MITIKHKITHPPVHDWDCNVCVMENGARRLRDESSNPHRKGTKVWAKRRAMDARVRMASDPRTETYWSL